VFHRLLSWVADRRRRAAEDDRGESVIQTVIIAAGGAALALSVMAAITLLVNGKLASISL
jgi:hypothetical protein